MAHGVHLLVFQQNEAMCYAEGPPFDSGVVHRVADLFFLHFFYPRIHSFQYFSSGEMAVRTHLLKDQLNQIIGLWRTAHICSSSVICAGG